MQEKSWEIKEIPTWVSQKEASALFEKPGPCVLRLILWYAREPFPSSLNTHDFAS